MAVIAPTPIDAGPAVPSSADSEVTFDAAYEAFNAWEKNQLQPQANALAANVFNNAQETVAAANTATAKAGEATTAAGTATTKAGEASTSASAANSARIAAEAALDSFDDRYLGQKSSNPTADNDGGALLVGALYFRTTAPIGMKVWTGTEWDDAYANLSSKFDKTGGNIDGNINFTGTARRITGDFSNTTIADRLMFQSNVPNGPTAVFAIPNGSEVVSNFSAANKSDPANAAIAQMAALGGEVRISSFASGSGTVVPMTFHVGPAGERLRIDTNGNILATSGALGYGVGAGGSVVQATSKATTVTLNKPCGRITMNGAALAAGATVAFTFSNTFFTATDLMAVATASPFGNYSARASFSAPGTTAIYVTNTSGGSLSDDVVLNFAVIKGAIS